MSTLALQSRLPGGRAAFSWLARGEIPAGIRTRFLGIDLASPVGLGAGIDVDGRAAALLQELGFGFLEVGPLGWRRIPRTSATDPERFARTHALVSSAARGAPSVEGALEPLPQLRASLGVQVRGPRLDRAVAAASRRARFITLPLDACDSWALLREARAAATETPLLVRVLAGWAPARVDETVARASAAGIDGAMVVAGDDYSPLVDGEVVSNRALPRALDVVARVASEMPTALSGGVTSPGDAVEALEAGAGAIALSDGFVAAGPGLPQRINRRLADAGGALPAPSAAGRVEGGGPPGRAPRATVGAAALATGSVATPHAGAVALPRLAVDQWTTGLALLAIGAAALLSLGVGYLLLAVTAQLLPHDLSYIGLPVSELCSPADCRIIDFIGHDRAIFGGIVLANAVMSAWIVAGPLRRREPWAWWTLLAAVVVDIGGSLTFLSYGYVDAWHASATSTIALLWAVGLALTRPAIRPPGPHAALRQAGATAWVWSPAGRGRLCLTLLAGAFLSAGASVAAVASTGVFVAQDLDFLGLSASALERLSDRLIPVIAHDRAEFGVGMMTLGVMFGASAWKALRPGARGAWRALTAAGGVHFTAAIASHVAIGYTSFVHLAPVYAATTALVIAASTLRPAVYDTSANSAAFPDV